MPLIEILAPASRIEPRGVEAGVAEESAKATRLWFEPRYLYANVCRNRRNRVRILF